LRYSVNVSLLDSIGFVWNNAHEEKWMEMYDRLIAYKTKNYTTLVPKRFKEDPQLGSWVRYQRQSCKDKDRIYLLNSIEFQWDGKTDNRASMIERLILLFPNDAKKITSSDYGYLPSADVAKTNIGFVY
jgi:hypothetical protein